MTIAVKKAFNVRVTAAIVASWLGLGVPSAQASAIQETTLYAFDWYTAKTTGGSPVGNLLEGSDGALYGAASARGAGLAGALFRVTANGNFSVLHDFNYADGNEPGPLIRGQDGAFYGATSGGGSYGPDTVFRLTQDGTFTVLYTFTGDTLFTSPAGPLARAADGSLYGTGSNDYGTVFKISPAGEFSIIYSFANDTSNGAYPTSLLLGRDGNLYGVTQESGSDLSGPGTIFRLTPSGSLTTLFRFPGSNTMTGEVRSLMQASDGNFYGNYYGTPNPAGGKLTGAIFRLTPSGGFSIIHKFAGLDGGSPTGILTEGSNGMLYGATNDGGVGDGTSNPATHLGSVFQLKADGSSFARLYSFDGPNGADPSGLMRASNGKLYGTTFWGGPNDQYGVQDEGLIFQISQ